MPVCTNCAFPVDHVYTTYKTKSNIRLGVCPRCDRFSDPLIEHPDLVILLDLILLKPRVFLHLLFNRGSPPLDASPSAYANANANAGVTETETETDIRTDATSTSRTKRDMLRREGDVARKRRLIEDLWVLATISVLAETAARILPSNSNSDSTLDLGLDVLKVMRTIGAVVIEGLAQHLTTMGMVLLVLRWEGWYPPSGSRPMDAKLADPDGRKVNFLPRLIPLTLLYTSLLPLLLRLILSIWYTPPHPPPPPPAAFHRHQHLPLSSHTGSTSTPLLTLLSLPFSVPPELVDVGCVAVNMWKGTDRIWAGTRLLGGMSAGFGLRVLLPTKPWETTVTVLAGWIVAGLVGRAIEERLK
ncbi:hypothetical protein IAR55_003684 [Kwoniella newhampshirensis]|uniref:Protein ARV n=1 Tax=Kwoniella newhampshirensis TaxID=1651941 RepID=A0AAW0YZT9_9TREE